MFDPCSIYAGSGEQYLLESLCALLLLGHCVVTGSHASRTVERCTEDFYKGRLHSFATQAGA